MPADSKPVDPNAPTRPPTGYFLFLDDHRDGFVRSNPNEGVTGIAKIAGAAWKSCAEGKKTRYQAQAAKLKEKYDRERARYVKTASCAKHTEAMAAWKLAQKKKERFPADPNAPTRPQSAYFLFLNSVRDSIDGDVTEVTKVAAGRWARIKETAAGKRWQAEADKLKAAYGRARDKYEKTQGFKTWTEQKKVFDDKKLAAVKKMDGREAAEKVAAAAKKKAARDRASAKKENEKAKRSAKRERDAARRSAKKDRDAAKKDAARERRSAKKERDAERRSAKKEKAAAARERANERASAKKEKAAAKKAADRERSAKKKASEKKRKAAAAAKKKASSKKKKDAAKKKASAKKRSSKKKASSKKKKKSSKKRSSKKRSAKKKGSKKKTSSKKK